MGRSLVEKAKLSPIEVLHVSSAPSPKEFVALREAVKPHRDDVGYGMPESSFIFQNLLRRGFAQNDDVNVRALVGRPVHPTVHSGIYRRRKVEFDSPNLTIEHVSVLKIRVLKQIWVGFGFLAATIRWRVRTTAARDRIMIVDASYISALPWLFLGLLGSRVRKLGMFADVYAYMGEVADARGTANAFQSAVRSVVKILYSNFGGFVLMTGLMNCVVNPRDRPHLVMEGLVGQEPDFLESQEITKAEKPTVMYVGALRREYGLDDLVTGFMNVRRRDARLIIYGAGPFAKEITVATRVDKRITYGGRIPVSQVMSEQAKSWILINTRRADDEFTKYSFPSKLLSYMASGTTVLTTQLPGMPQDYADHVYLIDGLGAQGVTDAIERTLALPLDDLRDRGSAAREFVVTQKNNVVQARRILDFALEN